MSLMNLTACMVMILLNMNRRNRIDVNVLIACEESQRVCTAFRGKGHRAFSCDVIECSGGHPEWHIQQDVIPLLSGCCEFTTCDGTIHKINSKWDMIIAHPPCTYMSKAGERWMYPTAGCIDDERLQKALKAKAFFMRFLNADCEKIVVENPVPLKVVGLPKPSQAIQPYEFGEPYSKKTLLWIKGLPLLQPTQILTEFKPWLPSNTGGAKRGQKHTKGVVNTTKEFATTFKGIAKAMAEQWGK